jgi:hypothetical protein
MASLGTVGGGRGAIIEMPSLLCRRDPSDFARSKKDKRVIKNYRGLKVEVNVGGSRDVVVR